MDPLTYYKSPPKRVVLGHLNHNGNSPISPMANLKLLTKVATSHISMEENSSFQEAEALKTISNDEIKCNRRLRSLSFICQKFLVTYRLDIPQGQFKVISLGNLAWDLGIEKRRVYDIINVVASLKMAVRLCKDKYKWYGSQNLVQHLTELKAYALRNNLNNEIDRLLKYQGTLNNDNLTFEDFEPPKFSSVGLEKSDDNRIGVLCQKFVMMFLVVNETALNLGDISKFILSADQGKTGMRRLYDVANVLETLGLIKRYGRTNKKPTFVYNGPRVELTETDKTKENVGSSILNIDYYDTSSSESSSSFHDAPRFKKMSSMLDIVCTELENFDDKPKAKRKLCLDANDNEKTISSPEKELSSFIKAPSQSFRFVCNQLTEKPPEDPLSGAALKKPHLEPDAPIVTTKAPTKLWTISQIKGSSVISADKRLLSENVAIKDRSQQSIKIIRPLNKSFLMNLQNGTPALRIVKCGEGMKLVKFVVRSQ